MLSLPAETSSIIPCLSLDSGPLHLVSLLLSGLPEEYFLPFKNSSNFLSPVSAGSKPELPGWGCCSWGKLTHTPVVKGIIDGVGDT